MHFQPPFIKEHYRSLSSLFEAIHCAVVRSWPQIEWHLITATSHADAHGLGAHQLQFGRQLIHHSFFPTPRHWRPRNPWARRSLFWKFSFLTHVSQVATLGRTADRRTDGRVAQTISRGIVSNLKLWVLLTHFFELYTELRAIYVLKNIAVIKDDLTVTKSSKNTGALAPTAPSWRQPWLLQVGCTGDWLAGRVTISRRQLCIARKGADLAGKFG